LQTILFFCVSTFRSLSLTCPFSCLWKVNLSLLVEEKRMKSFSCFFCIPKHVSWRWGSWGRFFSNQNFWKLSGIDFRHSSFRYRKRLCCLVIWKMNFDNSFLPNWLYCIQQKTLLCFSSSPPLKPFFPINVAKSEICDK